MNIFGMLVEPPVQCSAASENNYDKFGMVVQAPEEMSALVGTTAPQSEFNSPTTSSALNSSLGIVDSKCEKNGRQEPTSTATRMSPGAGFGYVRFPVAENRGCTLACSAPPVPPCGPSSSLESPILNTISHRALLQRESVERTFSDMVEDSPTARYQPLVVLDCANIGWSYGIDSFAAEGVRIVMHYFFELQVEVRAFIPASYLRAKPRDGTSGNALMQTEAVELLSALAGSALLSVVPAGDSDDAYILNYARANNGFVVSNDHFSDHVKGIEVSSVRNSMIVWLQGHRCGYTFASGGEFIFNPCSSLALAINNHRVLLHSDPNWESDFTASVPQELLDRLTAASAPASDSASTCGMINARRSSSSTIGARASEHVYGLRPSVNYRRVLASMADTISLVVSAGCGDAGDGRNGYPADVMGQTQSAAVLGTELKHLLLARASLLQKVS